MFYDPAQPRNRYWASSLSDPNVPAGYVNSQGSDGAIPEAVKRYTAGVNNQGAGGPAPSNGDPGQIACQPRWPNGILAGYIGGGVTSLDQK